MHAKTPLLAGACWAILFAFCLTSDPIPGVNEPHYLGKTKHYWQNEWCSRDLLMSSSDAHAMFFSSLGWMSEHTSLRGVAFIGRAMGLLLLATAWVSLFGRLSEDRTSICLSVLIFLILSQVGTLSGEWVVGGIEGKTFAWAFSLFAIRFALDRHWVKFGIGAGLAVSFHPVVGAWVTLAVVLAEAVQVLRKDPPWSDSRGKNLAVGAIVAAVLAAPGLAPALSVLRQPDEIPLSLKSEVSTPAELQANANYIQVFGRLKHHLDPLDFPVARWVQYGLMTVLTLALSRWSGLFKNAKRLWPIIGATVFIAIVALAAGAGPRPASQMPGFAWRSILLKLYPFRLADTLIPMVLAGQLAAAACLISKNRPWLRKTTLCLLCVAAFFLPVTNLFAKPKPGRTDWLAACRWCAENTSPDSLYVTPRESRDFKWYAQRAEWVNYKDCPQDAVGILEWNRRLWALRTWRINSIQDDSYSAADLRQLARLSTAEYLLTKRIKPIEVEPVYKNATYRIYRLVEP